MPWSVTAGNTCIRAALALLLSGLLVTLGARRVAADDLADVRARGTLRHLCVPFGQFYTGSGDGLDADLIRLFAAHLELRYESVASTVDSALTDLTGLVLADDGAGGWTVVERRAPRGDVSAGGLTILPSRQRVMDFSVPTFPTQVWAVASADSPLQPVRPSGQSDRDIAAVKTALRGMTVLGMPGTSLDPVLYGLGDAGAQVRHFRGSINDLLPALLRGDADAALVDAPDALRSLALWPGKLKVLGPIAPRQVMGVGFARHSPRLRAEFDLFFAQLWQSGAYRQLVDRYFPGISTVFADFFSGAGPGARQQP